VGAFEDGGVPPGGGAFPAGEDPGEDGLGAPPSGGEDPGGGFPESELMRPNRAEARRILKKYMANIASANAMSSTIVKR
jgi:hypothetical protein